MQSPERRHQTPHARASQRKWAPNGQNVTASGCEPRTCYLGSSCLTTWTHEPLKLAVFSQGSFALGPRAPPLIVLLHSCVSVNGFQTTQEQGKTPASRGTVAQLDEPQLIGERKTLPPRLAVRTAGTQRDGNLRTAVGDEMSLLETPSKHH